jgi:signal recognition particle subunit SEC65
VESKIYKIVKPNINNPYESSVALLRVMKIKEENRRREEEAQLALAKKKLQEKGRFHKVSKEKGTVVGDYASYNFKGNSLDVNLIEDFSELTTRSNGRVLRAKESIEEPKLHEQVEVTKDIPLISILAREVKLKEQIRNSSIPSVKLYDNFILSPGVELLEIGKKPKKSIRTFREKEGKMSREELNDYGFLPKIALPDQGTY